jgi:hypothetical protein
VPSPPQSRVLLIPGLALCLALGVSGYAQNKTDTKRPLTEEKAVAGQATGTFEVKVTPQTTEAGDDSGLSRMSLDKQFHGDLEASSKGQMLASAATVVKGSGGYVAMERVTGKLKDRKGSFALQHSGTMTRGVPQMMITVVPDSGTDQMTGLTGTMTIKIDAGKHSYEFDYTLPPTP